jgi:hypothetical protein
MRESTTDDETIAQKKASKRIARNANLNRFVLKGLASRMQCRRVAQYADQRPRQLLPIEIFVAWPNERVLFVEFEHPARSFNTIVNRRRHRRRRHRQSSSSNLHATREFALDAQCDGRLLVVAVPYKHTNR